MSIVRSPSTPRKPASAGQQRSRVLSDGVALLVANGKQFAVVIGQDEVHNPTLSASRGDAIEDHEGMRWPTYSRPCTCYALLFLGLLQASGCGDGAPSLARTPPTSPRVVANRAPSASGAIPKQTLTVGGNVARVDVAPYFSDPDGDTLAYAVVSSDIGIVGAGVAGGIVVLIPVSAGAAVATVTATDSGGLSATQPIAVTVRQGDTPGRLPACRVGLVLHIGESCTVDIPNISGGDNRFHVTSDGRGCYGNHLCR